MINKQNVGKDTTSERRAKILAQLETDGQVMVNYLSQKFGVSEVTIRNDLDQLEQKNQLVRARGGAIKIQRVGIDYKINIKSKKNFKEKQAIGKVAAGLINEGDTIILDSGTTTLEIAKNLSQFNNLTVITNALNIAGQLVDYPNIRLIIPGGILRQNSLSLIGPDADNSIRNYYCDKLFIGVDGIDSKYGISTPIIEEAHLNKTMIEISKKVIVVTDSSKFLKRSFAFITHISKIDTVITDSNIPTDQKQKLEQTGVEVILAI